MLLGAKNFDLRWPGKSLKSNLFTVQGHGPSLLKVSNSKSCSPKNSNATFLNILGVIFQVAWMLKALIWDAPNQFEGLGIQTLKSSFVFFKRAQI